MSDPEFFGTTKEDVQNYYICGQCRDKQFYLASEEPPIPCPDCGWTHKDRLKYSVPAVIKIDLSQY